MQAAAVSATPDTGEFKGWTVNEATGSSSYPTDDTIGLQLTGDVDVTANFGARCYDPELVLDGPGTAQITTAPNCFDADGEGEPIAASLDGSSTALMLTLMRAFSSIDAVQIAAGERGDGWSS